jgi:DNA-binding CsgD family transcriptional regulator
MTQPTNNSYSFIQLHDRQGPVGLFEKGVIIATGEGRIAEWLCELLRPCMGRQYVSRYALTESAFASLLKMPRMAAAFIEISFFGDAMLGSLDRLRRLYPKLLIVLFSVSNMPPDDTAQYIVWSGGSFVCLRERPEEVQEQLKAILEGKTRLPENMLRGMEEYDRLPAIPPYLTHREIEVIRCMAQEKTAKETACCLKVSKRTIDGHLENIRRKFGVHNIVGVFKLAVSQGILPEKELRSCRFKCR